MWCIGELTPEYVRKMEDVLRTYERPYDSRYPVVCVDEKSKQLLAELRTPIPCAPGRPLKRDGEYERRGTANVFVAIEPKTGKYFLKVTETRDGFEFSCFLWELAQRYPNAQKIHLVMDNLSTHTKKIVAQHLGEKHGAALWNRFIVHYSPVHGSWLNQAEIAISAYATGALGKNKIPTIQELKKRTAAWVKRTNRRPSPFRWRFSRKKAREKFKYSA